MPRRTSHSLRTPCIRSKLQPAARAELQKAQPETSGSVSAAPRRVTAVPEPASFQTPAASCQSLTTAFPGSLSGLSVCSRPLSIGGATICAHLLTTSLTLSCLLHPLFVGFQAQFQQTRVLKPFENHG